MEAVADVAKKMKRKRKSQLVGSDVVPVGSLTKGDEARRMGSGRVNVRLYALSTSGAVRC